MNRDVVLVQIKHICSDQAKMSRLSYRYSITMLLD